jgi:hypothetical protein
MKNRKTYKILVFVNLIMPIGLNRLYLGTGSVGRMLSLDYLYVGAISSLFYMDKAFDEAMASRGYVDTTKRG